MEILQKITQLQEKLLSFQMHLIFVSDTNMRVRLNQTAKCFVGGRSDDRLGFGTTEDQFAPVEVKNISTAVSCSLGHDHSCVNYPIRQLVLG